MVIANGGGLSFYKSLNFILFCHNCHNKLCAPSGKLGFNIIKHCNIILDKHSVNNAHTSGHPVNKNENQDSIVLSVFIELLIHQYCHIFFFHFCKARFCSDKTLILFTATAWM